MNTKKTIGFLTVLLLTIAFTMVSMVIGDPTGANVTRGESESGTNPTATTQTAQE